MRSPLSLLAATLVAAPVLAQDLHYGAPIPPAHRTMFEKGCEYLVERQNDDGGWGGNTGVTGICVMALLANGEDPNFGLYAEPVRAGLRYIIRQQDGDTGFIRTGMYEHGFAMLALADAYGAVDDRLLWLGTNQEGEGRTLGQALELSVRCAVTSQDKNPADGWRYSPDGTDEDASVSGAVMMGLLGARNAGIAVPDENMDKAVQYFVNKTSKAGQVSYSGFGGLGTSHARSAIVALILSIAKRTDLESHTAVTDYITKTRDDPDSGWPAYRRYYLSQALFQANYPVWRQWTRDNSDWLAEIQADDGSIHISGASHGPEYSTGMALLSAGLNYCLLPIYER